MFRKYALASLLLSLVFVFTLSAFNYAKSPKSWLEDLRAIYSQPIENWPLPTLDSAVDFVEFAPLPRSPFLGPELKPKADLGKLLFHDPRLSGSNQISCGSCHGSDLNWVDGRRVSLGHNHQNTKRNTPTIENVWALELFFWDGRAKSLEAQAIESIRNPLEMNQDTAQLVQKLNGIAGYLPLFKQVYGTDRIALSQITDALAYYQRTISSRLTSFDMFLQGDSKALSDKQLEGLHLFRTKGRCMNCHHGPFLTDGKLHNLGFAYYKFEGYEDLGLYMQTQDMEDVGKFKTPGLRNVMRTGPWTHNGFFENMIGLLSMYNQGMPTIRPREERESKDPFFKDSSPLLHKLDLSREELGAIVSFLESLSSAPNRLDQPRLPM